MIVMGLASMLTWETVFLLSGLPMLDDFERGLVLLRN